MAYSIISVPGNGTSQYAINFALGFIKREDVRCRVDKEVDVDNNPVYKAITWINDGLIQIAGGPYNATHEIDIIRTVDKTALVHNYSNGEPIEEINLDESNKQNLMAVHEVLDGRLESTIQNDLDMGQHKIVNMAPGTVAGDAVTFEQLGSVIDVLPDVTALRDETQVLHDETEDFRTEAAASAASALAAALGWTGNSTTSVAIGTGTKNFTIETGKNFMPNQFISLISASNVSNYFHGVVLTYNKLTGALSVSVSNIGGAGTFNDWMVSLSGSRGSVGATGPGGAGSGDVTGAASSVDERLCVANGTTGKVIKFLTGNGFVKLTSGVVGLLAKIGLSDIDTQAAHTVLANNTGSPASPVAVAGSANRLFGWNASGAISPITVAGAASWSGSTLTIGSSPVVNKFVNFVGSSGTVNDHSGVTSVTRNSAGNYTINFSSNWTNANYASSSLVIPNVADQGLGNIYAEGWEIVSQTVSSITVMYFQIAGSNNRKYAIDPTTVSLIFMGN